MMRRTISLTALLATVLSALAFGGSARAATAEQIIQDCAQSETGYLTGSYTKADLRRALGSMRGDIAEYSGCYDAIRYSLAQRPRSSPTGTDGGGTGGDTNGGGLGGTPDSGGGTTGGGSAAGSTDPEDQVVPGGPPADVVRSATPQPGSNAPVNVGGEPITPGSIPAISRSGNELPSPMVIFLVLLAAGAVGAAATTIGRRVLARRRA